MPPSKPIRNAVRTSCRAGPVALPELPVELQPSPHALRLIPRENLADVLRKFLTAASDFLFLKYWHSFLNRTLLMRLNTSLTLNASTIISDQNKSATRRVLRLSVCRSRRRSVSLRGPDFLGEYPNVFTSRIIKRNSNSPIVHLPIPLSAPAGGAATGRVFLVLLQS